ncbi:MAG: HPF/RaiA family ribosome-associated protein [Myxococcales bacterium]
MRIELKVRHIQRSPDLQAHVERRALLALSRFADEIEVITVVVEDVNGPRGGADKRCVLTARGPRIGTVRVEQTATDAYGAVDALAGRAGRSVARAVGRLRERSSAGDPRRA